MRNPLLIIGLLCWSCCTELGAQGLVRALSDSSSFTLNGNVDLSFGYYDAFGDIAPRRDRYQYLFSGNLNPRIAGFDAPLSAVYSQQETTFLQPFNRIGLSPRYKNLTAHLGFRSLVWSPLTLNGHLFLGVGAEYAHRPTRGPLHYHVRAMYGRLRRAVEPLEAEREGFFASYRRMGWATSFGVSSRRNATNFIHLILLSSEDRLNSIEAPLRTPDIKPEANLNLGINAQVQLLRRVVLKVDAARSALTRDRRDDRAAAPGGLLDLFGSLYTPTVSTEINDALRTDLRYADQQRFVGVSYNRIAPGYRTHGSYFFQNDLEELTANAGTRLLAGKANLALSVGTQRNNLDGAQETAQRRFIGSLAWTHNVNRRLNYNLNFSNFSSALLVQRDVLSDSLNLYQISTNYTASANYTIDDPVRTQRLGLVLSHQIGNSRDEYLIDEDLTKFWNAGATYLLGFPRIEASAQLGLNLTVNDTGLFSSTNVGPSLGIGKKFMDKKIYVRYVLSHLTNLQDGQARFGVLTNRLNLNYRFHPKHTARVGLVTLGKNDRRDRARSYSELTARLGYRFRF